MRALLWPLFFFNTFASPLEPLRELIEDGAPVNSSGQASGLLVKRDWPLQYPGIEFGQKCTDKQKEYVKVQLDEIQVMMEKSISQLDILQDFIATRRQPRTWGSQEGVLTRLYNTWVSYIAQIKFSSGTLPISGGAEPTSWDDTARNVKKLKEIYTKIYEALPEATLDLVIHCSDDFFAYQDDMSTDQRREVPPLESKFESPTERTDEDIVIAANGRLCHESNAVNAWRFQNRVTLKDEICICPNTFQRAGTKNELAHFANNPAQLIDKTLNDMYFWAVAGPLLHELTHSVRVLGDDRTGDQMYTYRSTSLHAYGAHRIGSLAVVHPELSLRNADTVAYFALAMYYSMCDWSKLECAGPKQPQEYWQTTPAGRKYYYYFDLLI
ncbi:hypothetical protein P170DRAFT_480092 [Aspergillus steynii IBT 23096]|uniref:Lysine-specific metallo-endopeptidase domain-containing protein n=1 Tax=Aspergillus steynii IBT 23096 TaxID=1392250 RepID=A0A2I2FUK1_9EURO|nr:uncharacterized protein P170DRAFT_480092 [Aspergillus steynii IBT 23096]PLB44328.1 hypothetical protein P170DRAFT_480092 [Aspergillus steynii IBT 23096]